MPPLARLSRILGRRAWSRRLTRLVARRSIHQDVTETRRDRYPRLFASAAALLGDASSPRILSFGCSSGEEVLSLRDYFPAAAIVGAEINRGELAACRRLPPHPRTVFIHSTRARIADHGPYDAVFCMAVLQRRPHAVARAGVADIARHYPFARFADEIAFLTEQLRPGGLLIVEHSQYRVEDADAPLAPVRDSGTWAADGPRFDRDGALIRPQPIVSRIFRKRS